MARGSYVHFGKFKNRHMDSLINQARFDNTRTGRLRLRRLASDLSARSVAMIAPTYSSYVLATMRNVAGLPTAPLDAMRIDPFPVSTT